MGNSVIFVRGDSNIKTLNDLENNTVAFVSPAGAGGYLAPRALFYKQGMNTKKDIKEIFTKNLSSSIHKVLLGDVSAASSEEYPEAMVGIRPEIATEIRERIAKVILGMINDDEGKKVLANMNGMKIKSFIKPSKVTIQRTKELINTAKMK